MDSRPTMELTISRPDNIRQIIFFDWPPSGDRSREPIKLIRAKHGIIARIASSVHSAKVSTFKFYRA